MVTSRRCLNLGWRFNLPWGDTFPDAENDYKDSGGTNCDFDKSGKTIQLYCSPFACRSSRNGHL